MNTNDMIEALLRLAVRQDSDADEGEIRQATIRLGDLQSTVDRLKSENIELSKRICELEIDWQVNPEELGQ